MTGNVICIENKHNNSNFTEGKSYTVSNTKITCNVLSLSIDLEPEDKIFDFAMCKFEFVDEVEQIKYSVSYLLDADLTEENGFTKGIIKTLEKIRNNEFSILWK